MLPRFAKGKFTPKNAEKYVGLKTATDLTSGDKVSAVITPVIKGEISDLQLYEKGTGYGRDREE